ncbi:hypothetical protein MWN33_14140 [Starkeya koreensis]|uniref:DUF883 domain-containing protein n=1 Tax=Ancylobacter koreensis TaxID=266121 RepID=A0ABT0DPG5_9HYPH|nr:hypothetical protein [Ancylobacter koreensis]MCK0209172.1 hypothetical protein [Ancylobacter koreensis]
MVEPKISNGIHKDEAEAPATGAMTHGETPAGESSASAPMSATTRPRIAGRPGREEGDEERSARRAARELWAMADGHPLRSYSFGTVVTAGLLGFVIGRLFAR